MAILHVFIVATRLASAGPMGVEHPRNAVEVAPVIAGVLDGILGLELRHRQQPVIGLALAVSGTKLPIARN